LTKKELLELYSKHPDFIAKHCKYHPYSKIIGQGHSCFNGDLYYDLAWTVRTIMVELKHDLHPAYTKYLDLHQHL
jgi:hypothetical protein